MLEEEGESTGHCLDLVMIHVQSTIHDIEIVVIQLYTSLSLSSPAAPLFPSPHQCPLLSLSLSSLQLPPSLTLSLSSPAAPLSCSLPPPLLTRCPPSPHQLSPSPHQLSPSSPPLPSPAVPLVEGVLRDASSNERVKFLLAERLPLGGVALTFAPELESTPVVENGCGGRVSSVGGAWEEGVGNLSSSKCSS